VLALKREALKAGISVNEKRERRGIQPRAVRAAVIGFPNVGKSALINRLLGRKMATSRNLPGVARQFDQVSALKLAICNDIGEASYDRVVVATALCNQLISLHKANPKYVNMGHIIERYKFPFNEVRRKQREAASL
jgi:ribosome biogenesis GTPase A